MTPDEPLVLGIETSCDETGVGIVRGDDAARRRHREQRRRARPVRRRRARGRQPRAPRGDGADDRAGLPRGRRRLADLDAIAVTAGPGWRARCSSASPRPRRSRSAWASRSTASTTSPSHVAVDIVEHGPLPEPCLALLVSRRALLAAAGARRHRRRAPLGATIDDAAGEAFDKVARVLGLPFPGGPHIDRAAREGDRSRSTSRAGSRAAETWSGTGSTSPSPGLKTAVARWVEPRERAGEPVPVADVAATFQEAVVDVLTRKAVAACRTTASSTSSSAAASRPTRGSGRWPQERCDDAGIRLRVPRPGLCTDNGAMVAALGAQMVAAARPRGARPARRLVDAGDPRPRLAHPRRPRSGTNSVVCRLWPAQPAEPGNF